MSVKPDRQNSTSHTGHSITCGLFRQTGLYDSLDDFLEMDLAKLSRYTVGCLSKGLHRGVSARYPRSGCSNFDVFGHVSLDVGDEVHPYFDDSGYLHP